MLGLDMLDVMIGLVTVYLSFGIACTAIVEAISSLLGLRSRNLKAGLGEFFKGSINTKSGQTDDFVRAFYAHPLVMTLSKGEDGRPSYIPTEIVGQVVQSLLALDKYQGDLQKALEALPENANGENRVKSLLLEFYDQASGDVAAFTRAVETHFDLSMERVAGWFRRKTQFLSLVAGLLLVVCANVDTIEMARSLAANPEARAAVVQSAEKLLSEQKKIEAECQRMSKPGEPCPAVAKQKQDKAQAAWDEAVSALEQTGLKMGWQEFPQKTIDIFSKIVGLIVSALAVSLGAPFWFNILHRFMQVRRAGTAPEQK